MQDQVTLAWDWQRDEYLAAERDMWAQAPARPGAARRLLVLSSLGFALFVAIYYSRGILTVRTALLLLLFTFGFPWLGARIGEWLTPRIRAWQFARHCLPAYQRTTAQLDDAGLTVKSQDTSVQLGWPVFKGMAETSGFILLYQSPKAGIYLPKRALSADQLEAVRILVREGLRKHNGQALSAAV